MNTNPLTHNDQFPITTNQHYDLSNTANAIDKLFLEAKGLKWLPWVGEKYFSLPMHQKILVIGESHYYEDKEGPGSLEKHQRNGFTRFAIQKIAVEREYKTYKNGTAKIFPNFHRTIFEHDQFESKLFWANICYYNFIQQPMNTKGGRPQKEQYENGWKVFFEVLQILQPAYCFFLGNTASKYFPQTFSGGVEVLQGITDDGWEKGKASRKATIKLQDGLEVKLKFLPHPSKFYSWSNWNKNLQKRYPDLLIWLKSVID